MKKEPNIELNLETKNKPIQKDITIRVKYYPNGMPSSETICNFCKQPIFSSFIPKTQHFVLCENCRNNFNRKLREGLSVFETSSTIGLFRK